MKKHEIVFSIIKIPLDFCVVVVGFFVAKEIRLVTDLIPWVHLPIQTISSDSLLYFAVSGGILYILLLATHWLYNIQISNSKIKEFLDILRYSIYWFLFFAVGVFLWKWIIYEGEDIPRLIIFFTFIFTLLFSSLGRIILNNIQGSLLRKGLIPKRRIILIHNKSDEKMQDLYDDIEDSKIYNIVWYVNEHPVQGVQKSAYLWSIEKLEKLLKHHKCDEILYIESSFWKKDLFYIWDLCKTFGIRYRYITNSFDITKANTTLSLINKTPVIEIQSTPLENWGRVIKRTIDIIGSILWIILTLPLVVIVGILIKVEDPSWPIIYKNRRIGQDGKVFDCLKFRYIQWKYCTKESYNPSWKKDSALEYEQELIKKQNKRSWPLYKIKDDPRKTKIWTLIEKYSIDEIPQFFNVLLWNMSLVGPRPHQPREVMKYEQYQRRLLTIKPGITGMAQVHWRETNNFVKEAKLDIFYIENWSVLLDMKILLKTFWTILKRK